ncbi:unnamed protein product [Parajaminaea phylloscopi]
MPRSATNLWQALSPRSSASRRDADAEAEAEVVASPEAPSSPERRHPDSQSRQSSSPSSFCSTSSGPVVPGSYEPSRPFPSLAQTPSHSHSGFSDAAPAPATAPAPAPAPATAEHASPSSQRQPQRQERQERQQQHRNRSREQAPPPRPPRRRDIWEQPSPNRSREEDELFVSCQPPGEPPSFTFVCLGVGGGPLENDCSCYVVKPANRSWRQGMYVLEGGSWLGALSRVCSDSLCRAFFDFDFSHRDPSLRAGEIGSFAKAFLISHAHLDHILGMVLGSASLPGKRAVFGLKPTLENLMGIFDGKLWPKLASFREDEPYIVYHLKPVTSQERLELDEDLSVLPFALSHGLNASNLPAPPTPTPLAPRNSYFSKRFSLPLSSLMPLAPTNPSRQGSGFDRASGDRPTFTSPFAPDRIVVSASGADPEDKTSAEHSADEFDQTELISPMRRVSTAAKRPKTASGFERAILEPLSAPPAGSSNEAAATPAPSSGGPRRAAAPRRVSIDRGQTHGALDSTAFFLTNKSTGKDVLFFGDVEPDCVSRAPRNKRVWQHTASRFAVGDLHTVFLECSFPAAHPTEFLWGHLSVNHLYDELTVLARCVKSEKAVLTRRFNVAAGTARSDGIPVMGGLGSMAGSKMRMSPQAMIPPSPLSAPGSAELKGMLAGLTVVVIHVKQALFPSFAHKASSPRASGDRVANENGDDGDGDGEAAGSSQSPEDSTRVLDPRSMQTRILQELNELEEEHELGARFVIAKQGMRLET